MIFHLIITHVFFPPTGWWQWWWWRRWTFDGFGRHEKTEPQQGRTFFFSYVFVLFCCLFALCVPSYFIYLLPPHGYSLFSSVFLTFCFFLVLLRICLADFKWMNCKFRSFMNTAHRLIILIDFLPIFLFSFCVIADLSCSFHRDEL